MAETVENLAAQVRKKYTGLRWAVGISGALALLTGLAMLIWPDKSAVVLTDLLAIYAVVVGVVSIIGALAVRELGTGARLLLGLTGVLFIVAAVLAFINPATSAVAIAVVVVVFLGAAWVADGITAIVVLGEAGSKGWALFYAVISILGGISLIVAPLTGVVVLWAWIAVFAVVVGIVQIIRAIRM